MTQNKFNQLLVDKMKDYDLDDVVVSCNVVNDRGFQAIELGAWEACLIPSPKSKPINNELKEGVKDMKVFIQLLKLEREVFLNVMIKMLDMHDLIMIKALLDSRATGMFID